jgi:hypothetical protein
MATKKQSQAGTENGSVPSIDTFFDLLKRFSDGVAAGQAHGSTALACLRTFEGMSRALPVRLREVVDAFVAGPRQLRDSLPRFIESTDGLFNLHIAYGMADAARRHAENHESLVVDALKEIEQVVKLDLPVSLLPPGAADAYRRAAKGFDPRLSARARVRRSLRAPGTLAARELLGTVTSRRLWALHGLVLAHAAAATTRNALTRAQIDALRRDGAASVRKLRDALHKQARAMSSGVVGPAWALAIWGAVDTAETWLVEQAPRLARALAATSADDADAAVARDAAIAYDAMRQLLALASGGWAVLRAWATTDRAVLRRFADAAALKAAPAAPDLPRTPLSKLASLRTGTAVEVAATVGELDVKAGGPAPRSVLRLANGSRPAAHVSLLVPFTAVDSFGVQPGVWVQARGKLFANGKDDLEGPTVQVSRINRQDAAAASFFDHVVYEGRSEFELRPGGFDLVAGRSAGSEATLAELGLRLMVGGAS